MSSEFFYTQQHFLLKEKLFHHLSFHVLCKPHILLHANSAGCLINLQHTFLQFQQFWRFNIIVLKQVQGLMVCIYRAKIRVAIFRLNMQVPKTHKSMQLAIFKPGVPACDWDTWFLKIVYVQKSVSVCLCPPRRLLITSGVIWHAIKPRWLVKQFLLVLYSSFNQYG